MGWPRRASHTTTRPSVSPEASTREGVVLDSASPPTGCLVCFNGEMGWGEGVKEERLIK